MEQIKVKRKRATKEEMIVRLEKQNAEYQEKIEANKRKIEELKKPSVKLSDLAAKIKAAGLSVEDVMNMIDKNK